MKARYFALSLALLISPGQAQTPYQPVIPFIEQDFQPFAGTGDATLRGQAFLRTVGGDVRTCAGSDVFLIPDNPYMEDLTAAEDRGVRNASIDPRAQTFRRRSTCDAQGNFHFSGVPKGSWIVVARVTWSIPHIEQGGERPGPLTSLLLGIRPAPEFDNQGGELRKFVELRSGDNEAILSGEDEVQPGKPGPQPPKRAPAPVRVTANTAPTLGVAIVPMPVQMATAFKIPANHGLWLLRVDDGSAAARAGLSIGDVVLTANGQRWDSLTDLASTMNSLHAGDKLVLGIWSKGNEKTITIVF
jgi:hypothetical protein